MKCVLQMKEYGDVRMAVWVWALHYLINIQHSIFFRFLLLGQRRCIHLIVAADFTFLEQILFKPLVNHCLGLERFSVEWSIL